MDRLETADILAVLKAAYPQFYNGLGAKDANRIVDLWAEMFIDGIRFLKEAGADEAVLTIIKMRTPQEMTAAEAWTLVYRAIANSGYNAKEEYDRLPPTIQRLVGSPQQLREWGMMNAETVQSVVASNFQRSYTVRIKSDREYMALPSDIKQMIAGVAQQFALGDGNENGG